MKVALYIFEIENKKLKIKIQILKFKFSISRNLRKSETRIMQEMTQMTLLSIKQKNATSGCSSPLAKFVINLLLEGKLSVKQIAEETQKQFNSKTSEKCVYWYASKMKINLKDRPKSARPRVSSLVVEFDYNTGMVA